MPWIKSKERLPVVDEAVLWYEPHYSPYPICMHSLAEIYEDSDGKPLPTHWHPLPECPQTANGQEGFVMRTQCKTCAHFEAGEQVLRVDRTGYYIDHQEIPCGKCRWGGECVSVLPSFGDNCFLWKAKGVSDD